MRNIRLFSGLICLLMLNGCIIVADDSPYYYDGYYDGLYTESSYSETYYVPSNVSQTYVVNNYTTPVRTVYVESPHPKPAPRRYVRDDRRYDGHHHDKHRGTPRVEPGKGGHDKGHNHSVASRGDKKPALTSKKPVTQIKPVKQPKNTEKGKVTTKNPPAKKVNGSSKKVSNAGSTSKKVKVAANTSQKTAANNGKLRSAAISRMRS